MMSREDLLRVHITVITTLNARLNFGAEEWDVIDIHEINKERKHELSTSRGIIFPEVRITFFE